MSSVPLRADDLPVVPLGSFDLSDMEFWVQPREIREGAFKTMRDTPGLPFFAERELVGSPFPVGPGYYALTRYEDVWAASRNPQLFCSGNGSNIGDMPQEMNEFFGSMINMDDPKHFRLRAIVSKGFTPKQITRVNDYVKTKAAYMCPSDSFEGQTKANSPTFLSYSMNYKLFTDMPVSESDVPEPSDTVMLMEESPKSAEGAGGGGVNDGCFIPEVDGDYPANRHSQGGTFVMADTHAKWYPHKDFRDDKTKKIGPRFYTFFLTETDRAKYRPK